jgi:DNA-binding transcriptional MocR family regulator
MERVTTDRRLSMTQQLVVDLTQQILAGELPAGSKLPTEQVIIKERGVSRTVVREAMSPSWSTPPALVISRAASTSRAALTMRSPSSNCA